MNKFKKDQEVIVTKQTQDFIFPVGTHCKVIYCSVSDNPIELVNYEVTDGSDESWWYTEDELEAAE